MMTDNKPYFSVASFVCAVTAGPAARRGAGRPGPADDPLGFGGLGIALPILMLMPGTGLTAGLPGLWRRERPPALSAIAATLSAAGLVGLALHLAGQG